MWDDGSFGEKRYLCRNDNAKVMTDEELLQMQLRICVERFLGISISSKMDFETLSAEIFRQKKAIISATTLRRFWKYQELGEHSVSQNTLDILSRLIGLPGWSAFVSSMEQNGGNSDLIQYRKSILTADLKVGSRVTVCWRPGRIVVLDFLGGDAFRVLENTNSKLRVGDTFHCKQLTEGMPIYCESLIRPDCALMNYIGGKDGGIAFHVSQEEEGK